MSRLILLPNQERDTKKLVVIIGSLRVIAITEIRPQVIKLFHLSINFTLIQHLRVLKQEKCLFFYHFTFYEQLKFYAIEHYLCDLFSFVLTKLHAT